MKYISLIFILICFSSCSSEPSKGISEETNKFDFGDCSMMYVKTVEVNGETFYASKTHGGYWVLGPRVQSEKK